MSIIQSIILGIFQGLGEFLPISSSAHLVIVPWLFGWPEHTLVFDVALHLGTLLAVIVYFWHDFLAILINGLTRPRTREGKYLWYLVVATIPGAVFGFLLDDIVENVFRQQILLIAIVLALFGIVLYYVDQRGRKKIGLPDISILHAALIGLSQAFAIFPGISRSGITMTMGLLLGFTREAAARFSFLLSAPIIFGAGFYSLLKNYHDVQAQLLTFSVGFAASAVVGFIAIHFLLTYLKNNNFKIFARYRFLAAALIFLVYFIR